MGQICTQWTQYQDVSTLTQAPKSIGRVLLRFYPVGGSPVAKGGPWGGAIGCEFSPNEQKRDRFAPNGLSSRGIHGQRRLPNPLGGYA